MARSRRKYNASKTKKQSGNDTNSYGDENEQTYQTDGTGTLCVMTFV